MDNTNNQNNTSQDPQTKSKSVEKLNEVFSVADEAYADVVKSAEDLQAMEIQFKEIEKEYEELGIVDEVPSDLIAEEEQKAKGE